VLSIWCTVPNNKFPTAAPYSHSVFEVNVQCKYESSESGEEMRSKSRLALIDLAGSERSAKLGSTGTALKEGNNINKSLSVLARCIKALVDKAKAGSVDKAASGGGVLVPFRESVLTCVELVVSCVLL
jgi:hypothetical protein